MSEEEKGTLTPVKPPPAVEDRTYQDLLKGLAGKTVTVVNPESYESAPVGFQLKAGFYRAKVVALGTDYLVLMTEFQKKENKEPVKQYIPFSSIKRVSMMKMERLLHI